MCAMCFTETCRSASIIYLFMLLYEEAIKGQFISNIVAMRINKSACDCDLNALDLLRKRVAYPIVDYILRSIYLFTWILWNLC